MASGRRAPFIGRRAELDVLLRQLDQSAAGRGGVALLAGDPGIGKTRLAEEVARVAEGRGHAVAWGRCYEGEGAPSFWPWVQILRALVAEIAPARLGGTLGAAAAELALVVPELRERLPGLPAPPSLDPVSARFRLFDAVATVLRRAAADRPLVLLLDDLHWADAPSLLLLEFVAAQAADAGALVVGTYRDAELGPGHPLARALGDLARRPHVARLTLGSLSPDEVAQFVEATQGVKPAALLASTVLQRAEGNPLFVGEMLRLLTAEHAPSRAGAGAGPEASAAIPPTVREVIGRRLGHLAPDTRRVLAGAAVVGREFGLPVVECLFPGESDRVLDALDEAEGARIVAPVAGEPGRYRFSHALVRETLYEEIPTNRRARLHRQVGAAIEALHGARPGGPAAPDDPHATAPLAELAHHFIQAAPLGEAARALGYARLAAERATGQLAYEEGARLYELALRLLDAHAPRDARTRCDFLLALGASRSRSADDPGAHEAFVEAAALARALGDAGLLVRAALGYGGIARMERGTLDARGIGLLEEALAAVGDRDAADRARVMARLATARPWAARSDRDVALSRDAVAVARRADDRAALADALAYHCFSLPTDTPEDARRALVDEIDALATELGNGALLTQARRWQIQDHLEAGDVAAADATVLAYGRLVEELREPRAGWRMAQIAMSRALREGRFADAERASAEAAELGPRRRRQGRPWFVAGELHLLRAEQGRLDEAEALLRALTADYPTDRGIRAARAWVLAAAGRADEARGELEQVAAGDLAALRDDPDWKYILPFLARASATLGDRPRAAALYDLLLPRTGRAIVSGITFALYGAADHHLGRLALALGRPEAALAHFEAAGALHARLRARPWLARTRYWHAAALAEAGAGAPADAERARALAREAQESAAALGMPLLDAAARGLRARLGDAGSASAARGDVAAPAAGALARAGLTAREVEVLRLLAAGGTYQEIADRLVVGRATVQSHAMSIYRKLDVRGRAEAIAFALRHGLGA